MAERVPVTLHFGEYVSRAVRVDQDAIERLRQRLNGLNEKPDCSTDEEG